MEIILDKFYAHTTPQICVLTFISDSSHNGTISKVLRYVSDTFLQRFSYPQPVITCSKLTIETLEKDVKYVQS